MEELYDLDLIKDHNDKFGNKLGYHGCYTNPNYNIEKFLKSKGECLFVYAYDINNPRVKEYMLNNPLKFQTMCLSNIYLSKIVKRRDFNKFEMLQYYNIFKEYSSKYIDNPSNILLNKQNNMRKLNNFDKSYNTIFQTCKTKDSSYRAHKSLFKKSYTKYLDTGDILDCGYKNQMYMFLRIIQLEEESSLTSSSSLDSISSGVST